MKARILPTAINDCIPEIFIGKTFTVFSYVKDADTFEFCTDLFTDEELKKSWVLNNRWLVSKDYVEIVE